MRLQNMRIIHKISETLFKEKHGILDPMPELTITSRYVDSRVGSNTFNMGNPIPVDRNPMPESTLSPGQGLRFWPLL